MLHSQSRLRDLQRISRGKLDRLLRTTTEFTPCVLDRYGLCDHLPARPTLTPQIRFLYIGSRTCSTLPSDSASRRRPCALLSLHLYQVVKRILTFKLSNMLGTQKKARNSRARLFFHGSSAYLRKRAISPVKKDPKPSRLSSGRMEAVCGRPFALPCP